MSATPKPESLLGRVSAELAAIEKRDWESWLIHSITAIILGAGLVVLLLPSALDGRGRLHFALEVSPQLFAALVAILIIFNTYSISCKLALRRTRQHLISTTIQAELARLQSYTDPLTEVFNRRSLEDLAEKFISRAKRHGKGLSFIMVDLDEFKQVNTQCGHLTGDLVLAEVAALLNGSVRGCDAVVRYGGDEFLIILSDSSKAGGVVVADRIARALTDWNSTSPLHGFSLTASLGMADWGPTKTLDDVLIEADKNMYETKDAKKQIAP
ncbi:MAG: GGDEF domain-containing protein [Acidobacteriia bacterium]|nr:GGDEF domain-containing protein [Terriglobia bacterium]